MRLISRVLTETNVEYEVAVSSITVEYKKRLREEWEPVLRRGPSSWTDRDWDFAALDAEVAFESNVEWLVLVDSVEEGSRHDLLGVLVTSGPVDLSSLEGVSAEKAQVLWIENIAIAPGLRENCPAEAKRSSLLKVGRELRRLAIERSIDLGCEGRIGLHAAGEESPRTYERWKMKRVGEHRHPRAETYPVYVGDRAWALAFLKGESR